jgi:hypothetical protein
METDKTDKLKKYIQKWVLVDTEIQKLQEKMKTWKMWKQKLHEAILQYMAESDSSTLPVSSTQQLKRVQRTEHNALSFHYLEECLLEILTEEEQVEYVLEYIRENREVKTVYDLKLCSI